jgi:transforming growth factor-beta-induced protein
LQQGSIVDFVVGNPDLTSLKTAVVRAGLVDALNSDASLTLFAPKNSAFRALPSDILTTLLTNDEFIPHLADLLLYHVWEAEVFSGHLFNFKVPTLNGETVLVSTPPIAINGNKVVSADNDVSNGVVHIIDGVLIPSWVSNSIAGRVVGDSDLSTLLSLVVLAGLDGAVAAPGELTLVAPTNSAFAKLPTATVNFLTSGAGKATLTDILLYHVFPGIFVSSELSNGITVDTLQGGTVKVSVGIAGVFFNEAKAVQVDILANNGVVHKIDSVLDPADDQGLPEGTIVDFVVGNDELSSLTIAVVRAGLVDALNSAGPFTVFAPNDSAFGALPSAILNTLLTNDEFIPHLTDLLLYHVVSGEVFAIDLSDDLTVTAANGEDLLVTIPPIAINGNKVVSADNDVSNGVVHIIDGVLIPSWVSNSIAGRVVGDSDLSTLLSLVVLAGLDGAVAAPGELTLVAPTNAAFGKLPTATVNFLVSDTGKATLTAILLYHVFPGIFVASELSDGLMIDALQGGAVKVSVGIAGVFFNDAKAVQVDILANNGVVHKIDSVLDPADGGKSIVEFVVENDELTALTTAVVRAGLVDALNSPGPFTLFAPNDSAFKALPSAILNTLLTNDEFIPHLADLLLYHVLGAEVFAISLSDDLTVTAANGEDLLITLPPIAVNGNKVISADNDVSNGVIHIIDGVLIPSWVSNSIAGRVVGDSDLSTLLSLVVLAGLDGAVAAPGELTLVAPTNSAFAKLPTATVTFLVSDEGKETLTAILLYHVFPGIFVSSELSDGLAVPTVQGGTVEVSVRSAGGFFDGVFFNDAKAVQVDILANNGVVHKIDTVLDPADGKTIVDFVVGNADLTSLTAAVVRAGLVNTLSSAGPFTLFAPNNGAFGDLPSDILNTLLTNDEFIPHLVNLLAYHVLIGEVFAIDLSDDLTVTAANGENLLITLPPIAVNGNKVVSADNDVTNGVVHIIDGVLIPSWVSNSIASRVVGASDLSTLLALVVFAGLDGAVAAPGELTLVAPTNAAFGKLSSATANFLTSDAGKETLTAILLYHVFPGIFVSSELSDGLMIDSLQGGAVKVSVGSAGVFFNDAQAVQVDILANNGVVHKIDTVLDPADGGDIVGFVVANPELTSLTAAVVRAGLVGALGSDGPFTLFAPNDSAFKALPSDILTTLLTNDEFIPHLADLLLYHVLDAELKASHIFNFKVTALNGEKLLLSTNPIAVNGNEVVSADNHVSNGVIHIIDGVLIPSWVSNSITGRVVGDSDLSTLLALVVLAGLDGALDGPGELTLVAPTNSAFAKLPADVVAFVTSGAGKATLTDILLYHVFPGIFVSSELSDGITVDTLQGGTVKVKTNPVEFNKARAVEVDILTNNGVVHKIDTVLDPADGVEKKGGKNGKKRN